MCNANVTAALDPDPMDVHFPTRFTLSPKICTGITASIPSLKPSTDTENEFAGDFKDFAVETLEWVAMVSLHSPRISPEDKIDPVLSRYVPPGNSTTATRLVKVNWRGFIPPSWAHKTFVHALLAVPLEAWFTFSVVGFGEGWSGTSKDTTILRVPDASNEYILWEVAQ
jgi:ribonuclease P/MRP protein subunit RPP40